MVSIAETKRERRSFVLTGSVGRRFLPEKPKSPSRVCSRTLEERERDVPSFAAADVSCASRVHRRRLVAALRSLLGLCPSPL